MSTVGANGLRAADRKSDSIWRQTNTWLVWVYIEYKNISGLKSTQQLQTRPGSVFAVDKFQFQYNTDTKTILFQNLS